MIPRCFTTKALKAQHIFDFPKISKSIFNQKLLYDLLYIPVIFFFPLKGKQKVEEVMMASNLLWNIGFNSINSRVLISFLLLAGIVRLFGSPRGTQRLFSVKCLLGEADFA